MDMAENYSVHLKLTKEHLKSLCGKWPTGQPMDDQDEEYKTIQFVFSGVIVLTVGVFGFVGNIFTCVFLKMMSKGMTPFNKLLVTLAIFDMMFICLGGSFITKEALRYESHIFDRLFPQIIFPLVGIAMTGSIYICVAISVERYLGICRHDIQIPCKFRVYLLVVLITTVLVECPKFFEIVGYEHEETKRYSLKHADHRWSASYVTYYSMWFRLFATAVVPFGALVFFNVKILIFFRRNKFKAVNTASSDPSVQQTELTRTASCTSAAAGQPAPVVSSQQETVVRLNSMIDRNEQAAKMNREKERGLVLIVCSITIIFFCCHLPRIVINMYEFIHQNDVLACKIFGVDWHPPRWARILNEISNALLIINASSNFVLYCVVARSFRDQIVKVWSKWFSNHEHNHHSESPRRFGGQVEIELRNAGEDQNQDEGLMNDMICV